MIPERIGVNIKRGSYIYNTVKIQKLSHQIKPFIILAVEADNTDVIQCGTHHYIKICIL